MKKLNELLNGMDVISRSGSLDIMVNGISNDSRRIKKDFCFVAIKGFKQDGLKYLMDAIKNGANCVVTESKPNSSYPDITWIQVKNDRLAFSRLAAVFYNNISHRFRSVGVTGTNGKTTIMSMTAAIFNTQFKTATIGTLGMHYDDIYRKTSLTTPEPPDLFDFMTEVQKKEGTDLVMEVSSVALSLHRVEEINFSMAIFTTFSGDHLDFHKTMEDYLDSKLLLFKNLGVNDWAVINIDDPSSDKVLEQLNCKYLTYGYSVDADVRPLKYKLSTTGIKADIQTPKGEFSIKSSLLGRINLLNIMAAITAGIIRGISLENIATAITGFKPVKGRLDYAYKNDFTVLVDYAHTDKALESLLKSLREIVKGRLITVFGAGGNRDKTKRPRMGKAASENADIVIVTSDNPRAEDPKDIIDDIIAGFTPGFENIIIEPDREKAIKKALDIAQKGDMVAVAGKGHEDYQIFRDKTVHFDDYEVIKRLIAEKEKNTKNA